MFRTGRKMEGKGAFNDIYLIAIAANEGVTHNFFYDGEPGKRFHLENMFMHLQTVQTR